MMVSDSQKCANERYLYPNESDGPMYQGFKSQPNATGYIKELIAADMEKRA